MILHENQKIFIEKCKDTAEYLKTEPFYIEKDYWVTYMLKKIATSEYKDNISFKGGTSLSKAYDMIFRFSEDVDLRIYDGDKVFGGGVAKRIYKNIENAVGDDTLRNLQHKNRGDALREQRFEFKNIFTNPSQEILPYVKLEQNYQSSYLPMEQREIFSYVGRYLQDTNEVLFRDAELESFTIATLSPKVTFAEKIGALEDYYYKGVKENDFSKLISSVRHFYDLHMMLKHSYFDGYLESDEFIDNLLKKRENDIAKFLPQERRTEKIEKTHYGYLLNTTLSQCPLFFQIDKQNQELYEKLKEMYENSFANITFGELPKFDDTISSLNIIGEALKSNNNLFNISSSPIEDIITDDKEVLSSSGKYEKIFSSEYPDVDFLDILKSSTKNDGLYIGITDNDKVNEIVVRGVPKLVLEAFEDKDVDAITVKFYRIQKPIVTE